jgi:hypothetical protein
MQSLGKLVCQSCGMPMYDACRFGTNKDGSLNSEYCHFCYQHGDFVDSGISLQQKIDKNIAMAVTMGIDEKEATDLANGTLPYLKRWQDTKEHV